MFCGPFKITRGVAMWKERIIFRPGMEPQSDVAVDTLATSEVLSCGRFSASAGALAPVKPAYDHRKPFSDRRPATASFPRTDR